MTTEIGLTVGQRLDIAVKSWPSGAARTEAHQLVDTLCSDKAVDAVLVFGSAVRSSVRSYDLDVLFVYHGRRPEISSLRMEIDLRSYSQTQVESLLRDGHDLICWTLKFGELVCEQNAYWSTLAEQWRESIPMPSTPDARRRGEKAWALFNDLLSVGDVDAALEQYVTYLTHMARVKLLRDGIYPESRPELPRQLRARGISSLAQNLERALRLRSMRAEGVERRLRPFLFASRTVGARFNDA